MPSVVVYLIMPSVVMKDYNLSYKALSKSFSDLTDVIIYWVSNLLIKLPSMNTGRRECFCVCGCGKVPSEGQTQDWGVHHISSGQDGSGWSLSGIHPL